ncbi:MAG: o-succinylbenzoate--CoA ligase [Solirubrobacterales bacterium]|nr:o-succinylbenzoate--CoA ligase [Solirubrobacterales bacterium]
MKLDNWLEQRAQSYPDRMALICDGSELTYAELEQEALSAARRLAAFGVRRDTTVAMNMGPGPGKVILIHALMKLGAVLLPISPNLAPVERQRALETCGVGIDLDEPDRLTRTEADLPLLGEIDLDRVHCRILTSGSTGEPSAIGLSYGNHLFSAMGSAFNIGVEPGDRWLCALPMSHISGMSIVMRSVIYGTGLVLHDRFSPEAVASAIQSDRVNVISLVSTMLLRLLDAGVDLSGTRAILVGGGPVPRSALELAAEQGAPVLQTYGMTETCSQVTTLSAADANRKPGSAGRPLFTSHLRIHEDEILVQGPTVSTDSLDVDGWLHTGDIGRIDEEGFLYVEGRIDDLIISGGENIHPGEVEDALIRHPAVAEAAVVGRPDPEWQQAVTAVVVLKEGVVPAPGELEEFCSGLLASYKVPKRIEVVETLPRTPSGKVHRAVLRDRTEGGTPASPGPTP